MTQPPDERDPLAGDPRPPSETPGGEPPTDPTGESPTQAWTPTPTPTPAPQPAASPLISAEPAVPAETPQGTEPARPIPGATPATPPAPVSGWVQPGPPTPAPLVAWEAPQAPVEVAGQEGYVIAGVGARIVAYLIDGVLVSIIPTLLSLLITDYSRIFDLYFDAGFSGTVAPATIPVTPDYILVSLISMAISYIYFVGFWTGPSRATPGMRGLKMQVADVMSGKTLTVMAGTKRWIALGAPVNLLALIQSLQPIAGLLSLGVIVIVFLTTVTNERRQGLHDRWAGSLVIRSTTSGDSATAVGCLVLALLVIGFVVVLTAAALVALGPQLEELMSRIGESI